MQNNVISMAQHICSACTYVLAYVVNSLHRPGSTRPDTATPMLSGTMGMSDWTFIYPESTLADSAGQPTELNLPTLDDFDMQIAVFEVRR